MDPLSLTASIVTLIDFTNEVVSLCRNYGAAVKGASWEFPKLTEELRSLRNVLESLEILSRGSGDTDPANLSRAADIKQICDDNGPIAKELNDLKNKFRPPTWANKDGSKRKALWQSLTWPLKEDECKKVLERVGRWKSTLLLALNADQA